MSLGLLHGVLSGYKAVGLLSGASSCSSWAPVQAALGVWAGTVHTRGDRDELQVPTVRQGPVRTHSEWQARASMEGQGRHVAPMHLCGLCVPLYTVMMAMSYLRYTHSSGGGGWQYGPARRSCSNQENLATGESSGADSSWRLVPIWANGRTVDNGCSVGRDGFEFPFGFVCCVYYCGFRLLSHTHIQQ